MLQKKRTDAWNTLPSSDLDLLYRRNPRNASPLSLKSDRNPPQKSVRYHRTADRHLICRRSDSVQQLFQTGFPVYRDSVRLQQLGRHTVTIGQRTGKSAIIHRPAAAGRTALLQMGRWIRFPALSSISTRKNRQSSCFRTGQNGTP